MTNISNCNFTGVHWDEDALESVNNVSKALLNLTELFKSQNIEIQSMVSVNQQMPETESNDKWAKETENDTSTMIKNVLDTLSELVDSLPEGTKEEFNRKKKLRDILILTEQA